jgi:hypothetical protein
MKVKRGEKYRGLQLVLALVLFAFQMDDRERITSTVEGGTIHLPPDVDWPTGTRVQIEPIEASGSLFDLLSDFDGIADDLPPDLAANLDHYIHAHPSR